ncbi:MAG TPA: hypothetical protein VF941_01250, partial [Clostridia bacterium]
MFQFYKKHVSSGLCGIPAFLNTLFGSGKNVISPQIVRHSNSGNALNRKKNSFETLILKKIKVQNANVIVVPEINHLLVICQKQIIFGVFISMKQKPHT